VINADSEELQLAPAEFGSVDLHMPVGPGRSEPVLYLLILPPYQIRQFNLSFVSQDSVWTSIGSFVHVGVISTIICSDKGKSPFRSLDLLIPVLFAIRLAMIRFMRFLQVFLKHILLRLWRSFQESM